MRPYRLFVFKDAVGFPGELKLNKAEDIFEIAFKPEEGEIQKVYVRPEAIGSGRTAMVLFSPLNGCLFAHYGYREMCEALNVTHSEFLSLTGTIGLMQLDGTLAGELFIKAFLPAGQFYLHSDTDNFADCLHVTKDCIHPLDWQYLPGFEALRAWVEDDKIKVELDYAPATTPLENFVLNYAGQTVELHPGKGIYVFSFVSGENMFVGEPYRRSKGRMIEVERLLRCGSLE